MDDMGDKQVQGSMDEQNAAAMDGVAGLLSGLPREPIPPDVYNAFCEVLGKAVDALGGGQLPPVEHEQYTGPVTEIDPDKGKYIVAFSKLFEQLPEGKPYQFSVDESLADARGLTELTAKLDAASRDQKLIRATTSPKPPPEAPPKAKPAPKDRAASFEPKPKGEAPVPK